MTRAAGKKWMIYGANGYTGKLMCAEARRLGLTPVLAGRRRERVEAVAKESGFEFKVFALDSVTTVAEELAGFDAILLAAGPFAHTSRPVVDACLQSGTHYLDITGEIAVFEACRRRSDEARAAGCVLLPGVGFDVVPTDCMAVHLKNALSDASHLELAIAGNGISRGTAITMIEGMPLGGAILQDGRIKKVRSGWRTRKVPFADRERLAMSIPWGDISTAYQSTQIPNIIVYMALPKRSIRFTRMFGRLLRVTGFGPIQRMLKRRADKLPGPDAKSLRSDRSQIWGRAQNPAGRAVEATLVVPQGYRFTAEASIEATLRVLEGKCQPGALTPASAFGADFVTTLPDTVLSPARDSDNVAP